MTSIYFLLIYSIGFFFFFQQKKKRHQRWLLPISLWTIVSTIVYLSFKEIQQGSFYLLLPCWIFLLFFMSYRYKKASIINGFLFNLFLLAVSIYLFYFALLTGDLLVLILLALLLVATAIIFAFGTWSLILLLSWNARMMLKREGHSLGNLLTLLLAICLTFFSLYNYYIVRFMPDWLAMLLAFLPFTLFYFAFIFLNFLTISLIYQLNRPKYKQDFIIVLGAGLLNGDRVSPLLAKRIELALTFYDKQKALGNQPPKIIFSGGQGQDETLPEAVAMKSYALAKGYPTDDLLTEEYSTTTFENMKFSKEIIMRLKPNHPRVIFSSNNYHIFRGAVYAQKNQLKADGIGAKTALYYLPTAFLREFIAMIAMHRKRHFFFLGIMFLGFIALAIASFFIIN